MLALICSLPVTNRAQVEKTEPENSKFPMTQSPTYNLEKAEKLARELRDKGIRDKAVLAAIARIPREAFVDEALAEMAYLDRPLPIGEGQTISQPYTVARQTELLELEPGDRVLEIGTGSEGVGIELADPFELIGLGRCDGVGLGTGIERILLVREALGLADEEQPREGSFIVAIGDEAWLSAYRLLHDLRRAGVKAEIDYRRRSMRAQMRYADAQGYLNAVLLGGDEIAKGVATVRDMLSGEQEEVSLDGLAGYLRSE